MYNYEEQARSANRPDPTFQNNLNQTPASGPSEVLKSTTVPQWPVSRPVGILPPNFRTDRSKNNHMTPLIEAEQYQRTVRTTSTNQHNIIRPQPRTMPIDCQAAYNPYTYYPSRSATHYVTAENVATIGKRSMQFTTSDPRYVNGSQEALQKSTADGRINNYPRYTTEISNSTQQNSAPTLQERIGTHHIPFHDPQKKDTGHLNCTTCQTPSCAHMQRQTACAYAPSIPTLQQPSGTWTGNHPQPDMWTIREEQRQMLPIEGIDMTVNNPYAMQYFERKNNDSNTDDTYKKQQAENYQLQKLQMSKLKKLREQSGMSQHGRPMEWSHEGLGSSGMLPSYPLGRYPDPNQRGQISRGIPSHLSLPMHSTMPSDSYKLPDNLNYINSSSHLHSRLTTTYPTTNQGQLTKGSSYFSHPHTNYAAPVSNHLNMNPESVSSQSFSKPSYAVSVSSYANTPLNSCNERYENINYGQSMQVVDNSTSNKGGVPYQQELHQAYKPPAPNYFDPKTVNNLEMQPSHVAYNNAMYRKSVMDSVRASRHKLHPSYGMLPSSGTSISSTRLVQNVPTNYPHEVPFVEMTLLDDCEVLRKRRKQDEVHMIHDVSREPTENGGEKKRPAEELRKFYENWNAEEVDEAAEATLPETMEARKSQEMMVLECTNFQPDSLAQPNQDDCNQTGEQAFKLDPQNDNSYTSVIKPLKERQKTSVKAVNPLRNVRKTAFPSNESENVLASLQDIEDRETNSKEMNSSSNLEQMSFLNESMELSTQENSTNSSVQSITTTSKLKPTADGFLAPHLQKDTHLITESILSIPDFQDMSLVLSNKPEPPVSEKSRGLSKPVNEVFPTLSTTHESSSRVQSRTGTVTESVHSDLMSNPKESTVKEVHSLSQSQGNLLPTAPMSRAPDVNHSQNLSANLLTIEEATGEIDNVISIPETDDNSEPNDNLFLANFIPTEHFKITKKKIKPYRPPKKLSDSVIKYVSSETQKNQVVSDKPANNPLGYSKTTELLSAVDLSCKSIKSKEDTKTKPIEYLNHQEVSQEVQIADSTTIDRLSHLLADHTANEESKDVANCKNSPVHNPSKDIALDLHSLYGIPGKNDEDLKSIVEGEDEKPESVPNLLEAQDLHCATQMNFKDTISKVDSHIADVTQAHSPEPKASPLPSELHSPEPKASPLPSELHSPESNVSPKPDQLRSPGFLKSPAPESVCCPEDHLKLPQGSPEPFGLPTTAHVSSPERIESPKSSDAHSQEYNGSPPSSVHSPENSGMLTSEILCTSEQKGLTNPENLCSPECDTSSVQENVCSPTSQGYLNLGCQSPECHASAAPKSWYSPERNASPIPESLSSPEPNASPIPESLCSPGHKASRTPENFESPEHTSLPTTENLRSPEPAFSRTPEKLRSPEPTFSPTPEKFHSPEPTLSPTPENLRNPETAFSPTPEKLRSPEPTLSPTLEKLRSPEPTFSPTPEKLRSPEPTLSPTPENLRSPEPAFSPTPENLRSPETAFSPTPEKLRCPEPTLSPTLEKLGSPEPTLSPSPENLRSPEPAFSPTAEKLCIPESTFSLTPKNLRSPEFNGSPIAGMDDDVKSCISQSNHQLHQDTNSNSLEQKIEEIEEIIQHDENCMKMVEGGDNFCDNDVTDNCLDTVELRQEFSVAKPSEEVCEEIEMESQVEEDCLDDDNTAEQLETGGMSCEELNVDSGKDLQTVETRETCLDQEEQLLIGTNYKESHNSSDLRDEVTDLTTIAFDKEDVNLDHAMGSPRKSGVEKNEVGFLAESATGHIVNGQKEEKCLENLVLEQNEDKECLVPGQETQVESENDDIQQKECAGAVEDVELRNSESTVECDVTKEEVPQVIPTTASEMAYLEEQEVKEDPMNHVPISSLAPTPENDIVYQEEKTAKNEDAVGGQQNEGDMKEEDCVEREESISETLENNEDVQEVEMHFTEQETNETEKTDTVGRHDSKHCVVGELQADVDCNKIGEEEKCEEICISAVGETEGEDLKAPAIKEIDSSDTILLAKTEISNFHTKNDLQVYEFGNQIEGVCSSPVKGVVMGEAEQPSSNEESAKNLSTVHQEDDETHELDHGRGDDSADEWSPDEFATPTADFSSLSPEPEDAVEEFVEAELDSPKEFNECSEIVEEVCSDVQNFAEPSEDSETVMRDSDLETDLEEKCLESNNDQINSEIHRKPPGITFNVTEQKTINQKTVSEVNSSVYDNLPKNLEFDSNDNEQVKDMEHVSKVSRSWSEWKKSRNNLVLEKRQSQVRLDPRLHRRSSPQKTLDEELKRDLEIHASQTDSASVANTKQNVDPRANFLDSISAAFKNLDPLPLGEDLVSEIMNDFDEPETKESLPKPVLSVTCSDSEMPALEISTVISPVNSESLEMPCLEAMSEPLVEARSPSGLSQVLNCNSDMPSLDIGTVIEENHEQVSENFGADEPLQNWPYLEEEVFSETPRNQSPVIETTCSGQVYSPAPSYTTDSDTPSPKDLTNVPSESNIYDKPLIELPENHLPIPQVKCSLSWDKIFNLSKTNKKNLRDIGIKDTGPLHKKLALSDLPDFCKKMNGKKDKKRSSLQEREEEYDLELGPATIEVRLKPNGTRRQWNVVDGMKSENCPELSFREENNNIAESGSQPRNVKSPIVVVRRIILKRRADESNNSIANEVNRSQGPSCLTTPPESDEGSPSQKALPKVVIKRTRHGHSKYQSFLRLSDGDGSRWQPVVQIERNQLLETMVKKHVSYTNLQGANVDKENVHVTLPACDRIMSETSTLKTQFNSLPDVQRLCAGNAVRENGESNVNRSSKYKGRKHSKVTKDKASSKSILRRMLNSSKTITGSNSTVYNLSKPPNTDHQVGQINEAVKHSGRRHSDDCAGRNPPIPERRQRNISTNELAMPVANQDTEASANIKPRGKGPRGRPRKVCGERRKSAVAAVQNVGGAEEETVKVSEPEPVTFMCRACKFVFEEEDEMIAHIQTHSYHCQKCNVAFIAEPDFERHLIAEHPDTKQLHHCLLCKLCFACADDHMAHVASAAHSRLELTQRWTIQTLFALFTGAPCAQIAPLTDAEAAEMSSLAETVPGAINYYHQPTPLQLAVQDLLSRGVRSPEPETRTLATSTTKRIGEN